MKTHLERSISINKDASSVYKIIADLTNWNLWSPWVHSEPTAKTQLTGSPAQAGQRQSWEGEVIGSGQMTIESLEKDQNVKLSLEFFKPWKSFATVNFKIQQDGASKCKVTWIMDSSLPFFMIFFKNMMLAYVGSDFNRGLSMLKELAETGTIPTRSTYKGEISQDGFQVVGITSKCAIADVSKTMHRDFTKVMEASSSGQLISSQKAVAVYHNFDIPKGVCEYTGGLVYKIGDTVKTPAGFEHKIYNSHRTIMVDHFGPYRFLGNPWSMAVNYQRGKKMKVNKSVPMYESYVTMPDGRPEKDIHTQIFLPVK